MWLVRRSFLGMNAMMAVLMAVFVMVVSLGTRSRLGLVGRIVRCRERRRMGRSLPDTERTHTSSA